MTGPSRKRARRGLPHIVNARNGAVRLAERALEGHLAADLAAPRPSSKAVGRSYPHAPYASNVEVAEPGSVGQVNAATRAIALALEGKGADVFFAYPNEGAIPTPGSRY